MNIDPTHKQMAYIRNLTRQKGLPMPEILDYIEASEEIDWLLKYEPPVVTSHGHIKPKNWRRYRSRNALR